MPLVALVLALAACGDGEVPSGPYDLQSTHNYSYSGSLDAPTFTTAEGVDVEVCWDDLTQDIQCHEMSPTGDVDNVGLIRFQHLSEAEVEAGMAADDLDQADISGYLQAEPEGTCVHLEDMTFLGTDIDLAGEYLADAGTFLLNVTTGTTPGVGARMLAFLEPDPSSDITRVDLPDGCGVLSFEVDLHSQEPLRVAATGDDWEVHWDGLTTNGMGQDFDFAAKVDGLMVGFYAGLAPEDLEEGFLDLETTADALYTMEHEGGTTAVLSEATDAGGTAFTGFDDQDGSWIFALRCSKCYNPAPPLLVVLEPVEAP